MDAHECLPLDVADAKLPAALQKACVDYFDYLAVLRDGTVIRFHEASVCNEFVSLRWDGSLQDGFGILQSLNPILGQFSFDRGVDVRLSEIVLVADAPNGS